MFAQYEQFMAQCWFLQVFIIGSSKLALGVVKKNDQVQTMTAAFTCSIIGQ